MSHSIPLAAALSVATGAGLDCPQDAGCAPAAVPANMLFMRFAPLALCLALLALGVFLMPEPSLAAPRHATVVFSAHRPLPAGEWAAIQAALRANLSTALAESDSIDPHPDLFLGSEIQPGLVVDEPINVYLEGDCVPRIDLTHYDPHGALGWVLDAHGQIEPFIHINCDRIVRMLGPKFFGLDKPRQMALLSEAIARVTLHEWVHVATQSSGHRHNGIEKATFTVNDLAPDARAIALARTPGALADRLAAQ